MVRRIVLLACTLVLVAAPAAQAATASISGATLTFAAADGEANQLAVSLAAGTYTLTDAVAPITAAAGCTQLLPDTVTCPSAGITALVLEGRDLDDAITLSGVATPATLSGGGGNDVLTGGDGVDTLNAGADADRLDGGAGNDTLNGDPGDDVLTGGTGADVFNGGTGTDLADFSLRSSPVTVSMDAVANDGAPAEADNVRTDVENATGGTGNDVLLGGTAANLLAGGPGEDSLDGDAANDVLDGGADADVLTGGAGTDTVTYAARVAPVTVSLDGLGGDGEAGEDDTIRTDVEGVVGGAADDLLVGGPAVDTLSGGQGADVLHGEAGADVLNGDDGDDVLEGGSAGDSFVGGAGVDTADYSARTVALTIDLDGAADDGETVENDNVRPDVERLLGGSGDDTLTGNNAVNVLSGGAGNDLLDPGRGAGDQLIGGLDVDTVTYATRTATVTLDADGLADDGEAGEADAIDTDVENLVGGSAADRLTGTTGANVLSGGSGNDVLDGRDGADMLLGGAGTDTADYAARAGAVTADPDGAADDGELGEGDTIETDVEGPGRRRRQRRPDRRDRRERADRRWWRGRPRRRSGRRRPRRRARRRRRDGRVGLRSRARGRGRRPAAYARRRLRPRPLRDRERHCRARRRRRRHGRVREHRRRVGRGDGSGRPGGTHWRDRCHRGDRLNRRDRRRRACRPRGARRGGDVQADQGHGRGQEGDRGLQRQARCARSRERARRAQARRPGGRHGAREPARGQARAAAEPADDARRLRPCAHLDRARPPRARQVPRPARLSQISARRPA